MHREALINERSRVDQSPRISLSLVTTRSPAEILLVYLDLRSGYLDNTVAYLICAREEVHGNG